MRSLLLPFLALSLLLSGCAVAIRTGPEGEPGSYCNAALISGELVSDSRSGLGLRRGFTTSEVRWPFGYSARRDLLGVLLLVDRRGNDVAREGDSITMTGGWGDDGEAHPCYDPYLKVDK